MHSAQGRTARAAVAVLEAGGAADRALFHVALSRVSEAFLLLSDDREALAEALEARAGIEDGALEALGVDPGTESGTGPAAMPAVDPEAFAELAGDWRALGRRAGEAGTLPFFLPGYRAVMARAAALSMIEDLPADMRRFVERMLARLAGARLDGPGAVVRGGRASRLRNDETSARLCTEIRDWPDRVATMAAERLAGRGALAGWRDRAEVLLAEGGAMQAEDSPHAPHEERGIPVSIRPTSQLLRPARQSTGRDAGETQRQTIRKDPSIGWCQTGRGNRERDMLPPPRKRWQATGRGGTMQPRMRQGERRRHSIIAAGTGAERHATRHGEWPEVGRHLAGGGQSVGKSTIAGWKGFCVWRVTTVGSESSRRPVSGSGSHLIVW